MLEKMMKVLEERRPGILGGNEYQHFSVLLPLTEVNGNTAVLFEVRANTLRRQPGEICFPGGKMDPTDSDEATCAVRETCEELGINQSEVKKLVPLDYIVSPFGTIIHPFVGILEQGAVFKPNPEEVQSFFTVPLETLLSQKPEKHMIHFHVQPDEGFPYDYIIGGENYQWQTRRMEEHFYFHDGKVIWGLTARVLSHFLELIQENCVQA
ncbi:NUDIX hydrolase [Bacillus massilinigeriensis]|uniref:NUDIX hydrolase n=1 Tax=Bacillus mediterraneensis TaxID=1805474 RepID=UPI0008F8F496|nr:CoA pyrophosphatase [Bacillus mediterraneensis]